jgi:ribosomal protein S18 acetylase RimI-like enzyme
VAVKYQQEFLSAIQDDIRPLLEEEFLVGGFSGEYADPVETYLCFEENIVLVTARSEGDLAGYVAFVKFPVPFQKNALSAQSLGWFVKPEYRGLVGRKLLVVCEGYLKEDGVSQVLLGVRAEGFGAFMEKMGYSFDEITYKKDI